MKRIRPGDVITFAGEAATYFAVMSRRDLFEALERVAECRRLGSFREAYGWIAEARYIRRYMGN